MAQGILPYQYEIDNGQSGLTSLGGLPAYLDLAAATGLLDSIDRHLTLRADGQGWTDRQCVLSLVLLNLVGGDCVEDMEKLESDQGFCQILRKSETHALRLKARLALKRRWRKVRQRTTPSASVIFRYLSYFHDESQESLRVPGQAFIPAANESLRALGRINRDLIGFERVGPSADTATLDMDATLVSTSKEEAFFSYKGWKAYQPLNVYWSERGVVLYTEFRDGNVPAGYDQLRVFEESLTHVPAGVKKVRLRTDTAGYRHDLMRYCEKGKHDRFGRIEFAVGCPVTPAFREAVSEVSESDWVPLYREVDGRLEKTGREWAEVCFVPSEIGHSKNDPVYHYLATREALAQQELSGMELRDDAFPFPVMRMQNCRYKIFGITTNMNWSGQELIPWLNARCGKSEEAHAVMKHDLAGGRVPSGSFGENAAWWWIMIVAHNLHVLMKRLVLDESWAGKRLKAIRFGLINLAARVVEHSRRLCVRISGRHPSSRLLIEVRRRIAGLAVAPSG
jgi:hypothetical protein